VFRAYLFWKRIQKKAMILQEKKKMTKLKKILAAKVIVKNVKKWILKCKGKKIIRIKM